MKIVNLTPHDINIVTSAGEVIATFPRSGHIVRVDTLAKPTGQKVQGVPVFKVSFGDIVGVPSDIDADICIVSAIVKSALQDMQKTDTPKLGKMKVFSPYGLVRNDKGQVIGAEGLC